MTKRKVLAAATLTALPFFTGTAQPGVTQSATGQPTAHTLQVSQEAVGPQWAYAFGMEGGEEVAFAIAGAIGCSFFGPVGGLACGVTGAL